MSSRLKAINNHLPQLKTTIEDHKLVHIISKECYKRGIILFKAHQTLENVQDLISLVWECIREDDNKCEQFIQILGRYKACKELVKNIRRDQAFQEREDDRIAAETHALLIPSEHPARPSEAGLPVDCTDHQHPSHAAPTGSFTGLCPSAEAEDHYNAEMEKQQQEAELRKAQVDIEKLRAFIKKLENEREVSKKEKSDLESQLHYNNKQLEKKETERDALKDSDQVLQLKSRLARLQKIKNADKKKMQENIQKLIAEHDEQIKKLKKKEVDLIDAIEASNQTNKRLEEEKKKLDIVSKLFQEYIMLQNKPHEQPNSCKQALNIIYLVLATTFILAIVISLIF